MNSSNQDTKDNEYDSMLWKTLSTEYLIKKTWLTARCDRVEMPTGMVIPEYYVLEYPEWVNVVAITKEGLFVIERQYRHARGCVSLEICAGVVEKGEQPLEAAKRELEEETGFGGGIWTPLLTVCPNAGTMTNRSYSFIAEGVTHITEAHQESTEDITVDLMTRDEVFMHLVNGDFIQAMMVAPLWKYFYESNAANSHLAPPRKAGTSRHEEGEFLPFRLPSGDPQQR